MHYAFDTWMSRNFPAIWFERFSDDVVAHCVPERQARFTQDTHGPHTYRRAARPPVRALCGPAGQRLPPLAWLDAVLPVPPPFS